MCIVMVMYMYVDRVFSWAGSEPDGLVATVRSTHGAQHPIIKGHTLNGIKIPYMNQAMFIN